MYLVWQSVKTGRQFCLHPVIRRPTSDPSPPVLPFPCLSHIPPIFWWQAPAASVKLTRIWWWHNAPALGRRVRRLGDPVVEHPGETGAEVDLPTEGKLLAESKKSPYSRNRGCNLAAIAKDALTPQWTWEIKLGTFLHFRFFMFLQNIFIVLKVKK